MKRGFTMIELLAVFTMLGIILIFALPNITSLLKKNSNQEYETFEKSLFLGCEDYIVSNNISVSQDSITTIYIKDIINSGYLKSSIVNPKNNKKLKDMNLDKARITVTKDSNNVLIYDAFELE